MTVYDFTVRDAYGEEVSLQKYAGQVLLINNSATRCGFTPQYDQLQDLYEMYHGDGFTILDFPCNQFAGQAPESVSEIITFCEATYGIRFPVFDKIDVNGENEAPLYHFLKSQKGFEGFDMENELVPLLLEEVKRMDPNYETSSDIKWNFTKFLINRRGEVVARFEPTAHMLEIQEAVDVLIRES